MIKDGGTWITTMLPKSSDSQIVHHASLTLSETGDLEGKLTASFTGLKAMELRMDERNDDDADKKKTLEDEVKAYVPAAVEVELTNKPDWTNSWTPLVAEFTFKVPGWVSGAGRKALLPVGLFSADEKDVFAHTERVHPIYFEYPVENDDDITITLPAGWQVSSVPKDNVLDAHIVGYALKTQTDKTSVHITRKLNLDVLLLDQKYYLALRDFYERVRTADEEQILLQPGGTRASN